MALFDNKRPRLARGDRVSFFPGYNNDMFFVGTSGYNYKHWRSVFYPPGLPQKTWLAYYANFFNTVEINATFYGSFSRSVFEKWKNSTPPGFQFVLKGSRFITHISRLRNTSASVQRFLESSAGLAEKRAAVLWQFPESFNHDEENRSLLEQFIRSLPGVTRYAFEFRSADWFTPVLFDLLKENNFAFVINDSRVFPVARAVTADFAYIRFHGPEALYASNYSEEQLSAWADEIARMLEQGDVFAYFNNDNRGYAVQNGQRLKELVHQRTSNT